MIEEIKLNMGINELLQLVDTASHVMTGDKLDVSQTKELSKILQDNLKAFSINEEIGCAAIELGEHKIKLLPGAKPFIEKNKAPPRVTRGWGEKRVSDVVRGGGVLRNTDTSISWQNLALLWRSQSAEMNGPEVPKKCSNWIVNYCEYSIWTWKIVYKHVGLAKPLSLVKKAWPPNWPTNKPNQTKHYHHHRYEM